MKFAKYFIPFLAFVAITAQAGTYTCSEIIPQSEKTIMTIEELEDVTSSVSFGEKYDSVFKVKVTIVTKSNNKIINEKSFVSFATAADVYYQINAVQKEGVKFFMYMDEEDQSRLEISNPGSTKTRLSLICDYQA